MKKSDLKEGMIVAYRNKCSIRFVGEDGALLEVSDDGSICSRNDLSKYNDDLKYSTYPTDELDIVKVAENLIKFYKGEFLYEEFDWSKVAPNTLVWATNRKYCNWSLNMFANYEEDNDSKFGVVGNGGFYKVGCNVVYYDYCKLYVDGVVPNHD